QDTLTAMGYDVLGTADNAIDALQLVDAKHPDLVLMDINLAGSFDGVAAASAIRGRELPVIFLTAHYDPRTLSRAKLATPVGYLTNPFEPQQLSIAIEMGINRHRSDSERMRLVRELGRDPA